MFMQFGIPNAPADLQGYINNTIWEALDDILICSNSGEEQVEHVKRIMQHLLEAGLYLKPEKI